MRDRRKAFRFSAALGAACIRAAVHGQRCLAAADQTFRASGGALLGGALAARPAPPPGPPISTSQPVAWFASDTGMDMAGNFAESRSAIDRQPTFFI